MPKVKFTSTDWLKTYHTLPDSFKDGDIHEVSEAQAANVCKTYPDNFCLVGAPKAKAEPTVDLKDKSQKPEANKGFGMGKLEVKPKGK